MKCCCQISLTYLLAALLVGCSESPPGQRVEELSAIQLASHEIVQQDASEPRVASLIPASELVEDLQPEELAAQEPSFEVQASLAKDPFWAFSSDNEEGFLLELPPVDVETEATPTSIGPSIDSATSDEEPEVDQPIASLLPPQFLELESEKPDDVSVREAEGEPIAAQKIDAATLEAELVASVIRDRAAATTGVLTDQRVNELAKKKIREAYAMANRGGYYAARQELIEVLRMITRAKDARQGIRERTEALAHGLRALEEAEDFLPRGTQLEADLVIEVLCASHRTPIAKQMDSNDVLPHQMISSYFRYAQLKLAAAVAGEPAGSMALHALGKLATHLGRVEPQKHRLSQRRAIAFQQAALLAHGGNHLAAHELATLLADAGHFAEAENLLRQVASRDPNAVVLRNLSLMQQKLGQKRQAIANRALAFQMAQNGASGTNNVQWLSPQDFSRTRGIAPPAATASTQPVVTQPARPPLRRPVAQPVWR